MTEQSGEAIIPEGRAREQVILPWNIAVRITLRGLKIRLGRSLITMSGVVLGIAFLMSVLTGEGLKSGLADENRTKTEVTRLLKLVEEEIGTFKGRTLSVIISGELGLVQKERLFARIAERVDAGAIRVFYTRPELLAASELSLPEQFAGPSYKHVASLEELFRDSHLLLLPHEALPAVAAEEFSKWLGMMRQPVVLDYFHGRYDAGELAALNSQIVYSSLTTELSEEEKAKALKRKAQERARQIWITVVSMLVTLIGIANAMLMSVTERIREIGTMKCLGALSGFVVKLFLIESFIIGVLGAIIGTLLGFLVPFVAYMLSTGVVMLFASTPFVGLFWCGVQSVLAGTVLSIVAAIYPATVAANMVPADALRTNV